VQSVMVLWVAARNQRRARGSEFRRHFGQWHQPPRLTIAPALIGYCIGRPWASETGTALGWGPPARQQATDPAIDGFRREKSRPRMNPALCVSPEARQLQASGRACGGLSAGV